MPTRFAEPPKTTRGMRANGPAEHRLVALVSAAAAAVASADGCVHPDEYRTFVSYMAHCGLKSPEAPHRARAFTRHLQSFAANPAKAWAVLTPRLERFAGMPSAPVI